MQTQKSMKRCIFAQTRFMCIAHALPDEITIFFSTILKDISVLIEYRTI